MGRNPKYKIILSAEQRLRLEGIVRNGRGTAKKLLHARILLMAEEEHAEGRWHDVQIARILHTHRNTVQRVRKRFVLEGEEPALRRQPRMSPPVERKLDGKAEAQLVAICCSSPPRGRVCWTLSLLVQELKRRRIVVDICRETVRRSLKKTNLSLGKANATAFRSRTPRDSSRRWRTSSTCTRQSTARRSR